MATFDDVSRIGLTLPEVSVSTWYSTPSLQVRKKSFCRMWSEREYSRDGFDPTGEVLVLLCDVDEKNALLSTYPSVLFSTPHYDGYGAMLLKLAQVTDASLADFLEDAWRQKAPAKLIGELDL